MEIENKDLIGETVHIGDDPGPPGTDGDINSSIFNPSLFLNSPCEKEMATANLQVLMSKLDGDDKCVACHAARLLSKKEEQNNWTFPFLLPLMLIAGFGNSSEDLKLMDILMEAYTKVKNKDLDHSDQDNN